MYVEYEFTSALLLKTKILGNSDVELMMIRHWLPEVAFTLYLKFNVKYDVDYLSKINREGGAGTEESVRQGNWSRISAFRVPLGWVLSDNFRVDHFSTFQGAR